MEYRSSEEDCDDNGEQIFARGPLTWGSDEFRRVKRVQDEKWRSILTRHSRRLTVKSVNGTNSERQQPQDLGEEDLSIVAIEAPRKKLLSKKKQLNTKRCSFIIDSFYKTENKQNISVLFFV